jgi:hypothetical protein
VLISAGWQAFEEGEAERGISSAIDQGYPFLPWQFSADQCAPQAVTGGTTSSLALSCAGPVAVGATVACTVSDGRVTGRPAELRVATLHRMSVLERRLRAVRGQPR